MLIKPNSIINGDCLDVMKFIPDKSIDSIICDLPYGITACKWDTVIPFEPLWEQYKRIIKPNGAICLFGSQPFTSALVMSNPKWFKYEWIWEKSNAGDCMNVKNKPMKKHENISVFSGGTVANKSKRRMPYFPQGLVKSLKKRKGNDYSKIEHSFKCPRPSHKPYLQTLENYPTDIIKTPNDLGQVHPTQKPVALIEYLIKTYTQEGELVLDNTAGSGTLAIAAINTDRRYICIEKDEHYFEVMRDRIAKHDPNAPVKPKRTKPKPATEGQLKLF